MVKQLMGTWKRRRGTVVVIAAILLSAMLGIVGIALDGGMLMEEKRHVQAAVDAAAMAGAGDLFKHYIQNQGIDVSGTAAAAALDTLAHDGYTNVNATITINTSPTAYAEGPNQGKPIPKGYIEVIVTAQRTAGFSKVFGSNTLNIHARSVARGMWAAAQLGIMALNPTAKSSFDVTGGGSVTVLNASVIVNSSDPAAAINSGGGSVNIGTLNVTGVPGTVGNFGSTQINDGVPPSPDPLRTLPPPDPSTMPSMKNNAGNVSGQNANITLQPGVYPGGIQITASSGTITMAPGIYYMQGGGFTFNGNVNLVANGVMIYNSSAPNGQSGSININAGGNFTMSPPTSGLYQGITLFQDRNVTNGLSVTGNGSMSMTGTFYAASANLTVAGNGGNNVIGSQYITDTIKTSGNGSFYVDWQANQSAPERLLGLVE